MDVPSVTIWIRLLFVTTAVAVGIFMIAGCGGNNASSATAAPEIPVQLVQNLITGAAPPPMGHQAFLTGCTVELSNPDLYTAHCGPYVYFVSTRSASVVPGDAITRSHWDLFAKANSYPQP